MQPVTVHIEQKDPDGYAALIREEGGLLPISIPSDEVLACGLDVGDTFEWIPSPTLTPESIVRHPRAPWTDEEYAQLLKDAESFDQFEQ
jgi:hypothetical protein